jgi:UrcA family protein
MNHGYTLTKTLLMTAALAAVAVPMFASAAVKHDAIPKTVILYDLTEDGAAQDPVRLYERLKSASRKMCGSTDLLITGSSRRVAGNKACYEGTLEAAVNRLGDPVVTALHDRELARL